MKRSNPTASVSVILAAGLLLGCEAGDQRMEGDMPLSPQPTIAVAVLHGQAGSDVSGTVTFTQEGEQVRIAAHVTGAPAGTLGFHLHEYGDCTAADFTSTGGHFNPTGVDHGAPTDPVHHAGDFGNITIGEDGVGHLELTTSMLTVHEGPFSVLGRAVILHAGTDDMHTQPTGDAGGRIGCGVVGRAQGAAGPQAGY